MGPADRRIDRHFNSSLCLSDTPLAPVCLSRGIILVYGRCHNALVGSVLGVGVQCVDNVRTTATERKVGVMSTSTFQLIAAAPGTTRIALKCSSRVATIFTTSSSFHTRLQSSSSLAATIPDTSSSLVRHPES